MYRVSHFVTTYAWALIGGIAIATLWANLSPASYYDFLEWRILDLQLPGWVATTASSLTPLKIVGSGLMAFFLFFVGKELWESLVLERGALSGQRALVPMGLSLGAMLGAIVLWLIASALIETAEEADFATGWAVPLGSDVVLCYLMGRWVFGPGHMASHVLLLLTISANIIGLLVLGLVTPDASLRLNWLALPLFASVTVWALFGRPAPDTASERSRRRTLVLWPYAVAGTLSWIGVTASGLPPALGLLPIIPAIAHSDRAFGLFAEAEEYLHDPLNRLAHLLMRPIGVILFLFGLIFGGIDLAAFAPTTLVVLAAMWIGKPLGLVTVWILFERLGGLHLPHGLVRRDLYLIALIMGIGVTVPILTLDRALPGGVMQEAARLGCVISLLAAPMALVLSRRRFKRVTNSAG
jgi:Na+:H+ antiporter, NhaA family